MKNVVLKEFVMPDGIRLSIAKEEVRLIATVKNAILDIPDFLSYIESVINPDFYLFSICRDDFFGEPVHQMSFVLESEKTDEEAINLLFVKISEAYEKSTCCKEKAV